MSLKLKNGLKILRFWGCDIMDTVKKVIAIIASLDTKESEVCFVKEKIESLGCRPFIIDIGARGSQNIKPDVGAREVAAAAGREWDCLYSIPKHEMITGLQKGIALLLPELYEQGRFDAVLSIGGVQNTTIGVSGMKALPIGVPKLMVSTVANGQRTFAPLVGTKDITLMPSVADISGINIITGTILSNAAAAVVGMALNAGRPVKPDG
jgi:uncharacterized protein (UPF0261 family)